MAYCSKACQKRHWKQHKIECLKCKDGDQAALNKKLQWRMRQFNNFYTPIIDWLVRDMYRLFNKEMNTDILFPEDGIVEIQVADLPQSAKRPRLYIKQVLVGELSKYEKEIAYSRPSLPLEPGHERVRYCLSYNYGPDKNLLSHHQFQLRVDATVRSKFKRSTKELYDENVDEHMKFINKVAKGESPKIHKVIKKILKENDG